ncbi:hypothetical protein ACVWYG_003948 [Pedobacter sp. UYEF25]
MLDMFQMLEAFDKYKSSMEEVGKAIGQYSSRAVFDKLYFFEMTIFSFLTGNSDEDLKNFSLLLENNKWSLSPAYDLLNVAIVNPEDKEELALTLASKEKKLGLVKFQYFGEKLGLNEEQIKSVFKRFNSCKPLAFEWTQKSSLSEEITEKYINLVEEKYQPFY